MTDPKIEDHSDEMDEDLHQLEEHISDAEGKLEDRKEAADVVDDVAGDRKGEQDRGGGDDPKGAKEDTGAGAPGGSQDGPGAGDAGAGDDDERVDEEMASPT